MSVDVCDHRQPGFSAQRPQAVERLCIKHANAGRVCIGVEFVVENPTGDDTLAVLGFSEQKGA